MQSKLSFDSATIVGGLTALGVYAIYNHALPNTTDLRSAMPHNEDVEKCRKGAAFESAALVGVTFFIARDLNSYLISGVALVLIDLHYKHANAVHPATGKLDVAGKGESIAPGLAEAYPMSDYTETA